MKFMCYVSGGTPISTFPAVQAINGEQRQDFEDVAKALGITEYELVEEADVAAWIRAHTPVSACIAETIADYENRVQQRLDAFARTKTYENMLSACTYATSTNPVFQVEGQYCVAMRDATWAAAQTFLNGALAAVTAGERGIPAWEEVEKKLPILEWPHVQ